MRRPAGAVDRLEVDGTTRDDSDPQAGRECHPGDQASSADSGHEASKPGGDSFSAGGGRDRDASGDRNGNEGTTKGPRKPSGQPSPQHPPPNGLGNHGGDIDSSPEGAPNGVAPGPSNRSEDGTDAEAQQGAAGGAGAGATSSSADATKTSQSSTRATGTEATQGPEGGAGTETKPGPEVGPGTRPQHGSVSGSATDVPDAPEGATGGEPTGDAGTDVDDVLEAEPVAGPVGGGETQRNFMGLMARLDATPSFTRADEIDMEIDDTAPEGWSAGHVEAWQLFDDVEPLVYRSLASIFAQHEAFPEIGYARVDEDNHRFSFPAVDLDGAAFDPSVRVKVSTAEPEKEAEWVSVKALPHGQRAEELYIDGRIFVHILVEDSAPGGRRKFQRLTRAVTLKRVPLADASHFSDGSTSPQGRAP